MAGTDTTETRTPLNSFILTEEGTNMFPWATELASQYSATPSELANGQNTILTNGETYFPPEAVEEIGVDTLNYMNNKPREGGHAAIDRVIAMTTLQGLRPMNEGGEVMPNYAGGGMVQDQMPGYRYGGMTKKKKMMGYENGGNVPMTPASADFYDKGYILPETDMGGESVAPYEAGVMPGDPMTNWLSSGLIDPEDLDEPRMSAPDILKMIQENNKSMDGLDKKQKMLDRASVLGLLGLLYKANKNNAVFKGMQEGGMIDYQNGGEVSDSLYWANHPANNPEMNGGSIGVVREQATMLQDSMKADTANKAKKALQLLKLKGLLEEGEAIEYQNPQRMMNPNMIPTPDEAEMMQNMMRRLSI